MSRNRLKLLGRRFGKLVVIKLIGPDSHKDIVWECRCDCGKIIRAKAGALSSGNPRSCSISCGNTKDLSGKRFGKLVAVKKVGASRFDGVLWACDCDCGNAVRVPSGRLSSESTASCGCLRRDAAREIIGHKFHKLTVVEILVEGGKNNSRSMAKCECECGDEITIRVSQLLSGAAKSCGCLLRRRGEENPHWIKNLPQEERQNRRRQGHLNKMARNSVYKRDGYRCSCCGCGFEKNHPLTINAHHIESWNSNKEKRYDIENMTTLCQPCHRFFHSMYGNKNNAKQLEEFKLFFVKR